MGIRYYYHKDNFITLLATLILYSFVTYFRLKINKNNYKEF